MQSPISSLIFLLCYSAITLGSSLSYDCLAIFENTRLTEIEPSTVEDAITLLECHHICRDKGFENCAIYVFDSEQNLCKMYSQPDGQLGVIEEDVLWNTLVRLKPDCFNDQMIGRKKRVPPLPDMTVAPIGTGGRWGQWLEWTHCSVSCGLGERKRSRVCESYRPPCEGQTTEMDDCHEQPCDHPEPEPGPEAVNKMTTERPESSSQPVTQSSMQLQTQPLIPEPEPDPILPEPTYIEFPIRTTQLMTEFGSEQQTTVPTQPELHPQPEPEPGPEPPLPESTSQVPSQSQTPQTPAPWPQPSPQPPTRPPIQPPTPRPQTSQPQISGQWGPWGRCSVICGGGNRTRTKRCPYGCPPNTQTSESETCNPQSCCAQWCYWSPCSATCGAGLQKRFRRCMIEAPYKPIGYATKEETDQRECVGQKPSCADWSAWGPWSPCSDTCCGGWQIRERRCTTQSGQISDQCPGDPKEQQLCNEFDCPQLGPWHDWGPCSQTCGAGARIRERQCVNDQRFCTGANGTYPGCTCANEGPTTENEPCQLPSCAEWSAWGEWGPCGATCGGGQQQRERKCTTPNGQSSNECAGNGNEQQRCNEFNCPSFGPWQEWGPCSKTCGGGSRTRERQCTNDPGICSGANATLPTCSCGNVEGGKASENETCNNEPCPEWAEWQPWSQCSVTCGNGTQTRKRTCDPPGGSCIGSDTETKECSEHACYQWSSWSQWSECTTLCGGGSRNRARTCPEPGQCGDLGNETSVCNMIPCSEWGNWSPWSDCSVTCEGGDRSRTRSCPVPKACIGGDPAAYEADQVPCNPEPCPTWTAWTEWGTCSKTCGDGNRNRKRTCSIPDGCLGRGEDVEPCRIKKCTLGTNWSEWSPCTATCEGGTQTRSRVTCPAGPPTCPIEEATQACNPQPCPQWTQWGPWGSCSKTCGGGQRTRTRSCPEKAGCVGQATDIDPHPCNDFGCTGGRRRRLAAG